MEIIFVIAILAIIPAAIAERKGRNIFLWWLFGAALFIIALPMALLAKPTPEAVRQNMRDDGRVECPHCAEYIKRAARVCPFCQQEVKKAVP